MTSPILKRIVRDSAVPELLDILSSRLSPTDLQSMLLEVYRRRAAARTPRDVLEQYRTNRFVQPGHGNAKANVQFDRLAFELLPDGFEVVEVSPVCPLGTVSALTPLSQDLALTTVRNTEVCSDSTNAMALECAVRRQQLRACDSRSVDVVRLCSSQRVLRTQVFEGAASFPHFRLLGMSTAGRGRADYAFELSALREQADFHMRLAEQVVRPQATGVGIELNVVALISAVAPRLEADLVPRLSHDHPDVAVGFTLAPEMARGYYSTARFQIWVLPPNEDGMMLVDGGFTDWTQQLLSDKKERLLISGLGTERLVAQSAE